ncbi:methyltransferase [Brucella pseudogrignonensis]|uniref:methyltransferase n=1 Tax=Brucella pseudogrignonensis TaxID=419475 RepID=UPI001EDC5D90|nr:methyltransferase [Brucella pseudogrignonensis]UKK94968.1 methyltransferase [Brucella pseudogrignonensis]
MFVLANWQESASHVNSAAGAFFTPFDLAMDFAIETYAGRIIDLCAGVGMLSFAVKMRHVFQSEGLDLTCVEINPDYVAVGRKLLPEANWIEASVFDVLDMDLGHFDIAISNPPFGAIKRPDGKKSPRYTGADFEFHVIDIASHLASYGAFIVPQMSAGFNYSGRSSYERQTSGKAVKFQEQTGLHFDTGCGVDTAYFIDQWKGVSPMCEIVCVDFTDARPVATKVQPANYNMPAQSSLFGDAA